MIENNDEVVIVDQAEKNIFSNFTQEENFQSNSTYIHLQDQQIPDLSQVKTIDQFA